MKFHVGALATVTLFSFVSITASYNPYSFFFSFSQKPCVPFSTHYVSNSPYSNDKYKCTVLYGTDLDYMVEIWAWYPPLYIQYTPNGERYYLNSMHMRLYKQKNEDFYHISWSISPLGWKPSFGSDDTFLSKDTVERVFKDTQFPIKQFPANTGRYDSYDLSTHSLKELSEGEQFNALKGFIAFVNIGFKEVKLDENDFGATMDFYKKWISPTTWGRWSD
jgi:hypothetical protein